MPAKAKKITLYLGNGTLDGLVNISESDGWDLGGELFSCPRDNLKDLIEDDTIDKLGVYLLLSNKRVYVGQAVDVKTRLKQHLLGKDWWERAIVLTSDRNGLNESFITYLEAALIERATECGTLDVDNKTKGNKHTLNRADRQILDQYLDEAYFIMELIGINVFTKNKFAKGNGKTVLPPIIDKTQNQIELRAKREVGLFLKDQKVELYKFYSYAKLQERKNVFWINPDIKLLNEEWMIVLNNQVTRQIHILKIPANTFKWAKQYDGKSLKVRPDKPIYIDLNIHAKTFIDVGSKLSFKEYLTDTFNY